MGNRVEGKKGDCPHLDKCRAAGECQAPLTEYCRTVLVPGALVDTPQPKLQVWFGAMPESNGRANWTAILHRGELHEGHTIHRSEMHDQVRYHADQVRWLIGELKERPHILNYDGNMRNPPGWKHPCGTPDFDPTQKCCIKDMRPGEVQPTMCLRCKNPHYRCDRGG